jgi:hypothetical protein
MTVPLSRLGRGIAWTVLFPVALVAVLLMGGMSTSRLATDDARVLASMPLTTAGLEAGSNAPLFTLTAMAPGQRYERCIVIAANVVGSAVRFAVSVVSGDLAPWLKVEATTGTGTSRGCGDFVADGAAFYTGSLAALDSEGTDGVPTGWLPKSSERRTFRLALEVVGDARAAGAKAVATLEWRQKQSLTAPTTAPATSTPVAPRGPGPTHPATTPSAVPSPFPRLSNAPRPSVSSQNSRATSPGATAAQGSSAAAAPAAVAGTAGSALPCTPATAARVSDLVAGIARFSALPLLLLFLVLLFLAVQDRLDRKDPKLAQAPLYGECEQKFPENGSIPWRKP